MDKAMTKNHFSGKGPFKGKDQTNWRFTELTNRTSKLKGRLFDEIPKA